MKYFSFQWHITDNCDQRCKHCYIFSKDPNKKLYSMDFEEMKEVIKKCCNFSISCNRKPYFFITGGDPILHPQFWPLIEYLKEKKLPFAIMGNPFHLNENVCRKLKFYGCRSYQLSLDGMKDIHDWMRCPGSFEETIKALHYLKKANLKSVIMMTVSEVNKADLLPVIDLAVKNQVDTFAFARYVPCGGEIDTLIDPLEYKLLLQDVEVKYKSYESQGVHTFFNRKDHLHILLNYENDEFKIPEETKQGLIYSGCNCGNCHLTILPTGDIFACRRVAHSKLGNIFKNNLEDIWFNKMESYREYDHFEKCSKCELLAFCRGCPAVAKGVTGNFYGPDPQCWKEINTEN